MSDDKTSSTRSALLDDNPDALFADGLDAAVIGIARRCGQPSLVAYSVSKCIDVLVAGGMTHDEATEHFDFNTAGSWVGPHTPVFVYDY